MQTHDDQALLTQYVTGRSESAFAEIVRRNVGLVYSSALRQVRDPHMAEDVTQAVFLILSQRAAKIRPGTVLSAWLWTAARFAAKDALKMERRRKAREGRAGVALLQAARDASTDPHRVPLGGVEPKIDALMDEWSAMSPVLDGAMERLGESARTAVVLRFFEGKSFKEVGVRLGITEDAAKQRVFRGLQRLRQSIGPRGDAGSFLSVDAIAMGMLAHAVTAAPPAVTATAISVAGKASMAATAHVALAKGAVSLMNGAKIKALAAVAATILAIGGTGAVAMKILTAPPSYSAPPAQQPTMVAYESPAAPRATPLQFGPSFIAQPAVPPYAGPPLVGTVYDTNGRPVTDVEVLCSTVSEQVMLQGEQRPDTPRTRTDRVGHFEIMPKHEPKEIVVRTDDAFAVVSAANLRRAPDVRMTAWGRLEGVLRNGKNLAAGREVELDRIWQNKEVYAFNVVHNNTVRTTPDGRYVFEHVMPGEVWIVERTNRYGTTLRRSRTSVLSGQTARADLGGSGRVVTGRVVMTKTMAPGAGSLRFDCTLVPVIDPVPTPANLESMKSAERDAFRRKEQDRGEREMIGTFGFDVSPAGTFHIDDVPPGKYRLRGSISLLEPGGYYVEEIGSASMPVTIGDPPAGDGSAVAPIDIGVLKITPDAQLTRGEPAPALQVQRADGSTLRLSDFQGKYVLLHFWSSGRTDRIADIEDLKVIYDRFGDEPERFAVVGINMDGDRDEAQQFLKSRNVCWTQGYAGKGAWKTLPHEYFRSGSQIFLIGPDGKLIAKSISGRGAWAEVDRVMGGRGGFK